MRDNLWEDEKTTELRKSEKRKSEVHSEEIVVLDMSPIPITSEQMTQELEQDETYQAFLSSTNNIEE